MSATDYPLLPSPAPFAERDNDPLTETTVCETMLVDTPYIKAVEEKVSLPGGGHSSRFCIRHSGAAGMIALDEDGTILLERQWRHPMKRSFWELPAGKLDPNESEDVCATRELIEECGVKAERWTRLGELHNAIGYSNERLVIYLAEGLTACEQQLDEGEHLEVYRVDWREALEMCHDGRITDVKTIVGLFWLERYLAERN